MISCLWCRWTASNAIDDGHPLPPSAQRHIDGCPACRRFYRTAVMLHERLPHAVDPGSDVQALVAGVMDRLGQVSAAPQSAVRARRSWGPPLAAAAAVLLIVAVAGSVMLLVNHRSSPVGSDPAAALAQIIREAMPAGDAAVPDPATLGSVVTRPYARELDRLGRQAVANLQFVASCAGIDLQAGRLPLQEHRVPPDR